MNRSHKLTEILGRTGADAAIITSSENVFYLSGFTAGDDACLIITESGQFIITDSRYTIQAGIECPQYELVSGSSANTKLIAEVVTKCGKKSIAFENQRMTVEMYLTLKELLPDAEFIPLNSELTQVRAVKDENEIAKMREALRLADEAFCYVYPRIKKNMRETDVAALIEEYMRRGGAQKPSFDTICASGERSAMPHGVATGKFLTENNFLTMDYGCILDGYCSDITRTVFIGTPTEYQRKMYDTVLSAQSAAEKMITEGVLGCDADKAARDVIGKAFDAKYFSHSLGHGVGIEIHELPNLSPRNKNPLNRGNIITVEPGIYIEGFGGVRIEDMAVITQGGAEIMTKSPKELIII
ncbi:MAG: aminopeptidase P family protein [Clostridia bacterium]|nr:aminopeptidase P family protein [Clostridia bacterium]